MGRDKLTGDREKCSMELTETKSDRIDEMHWKHFLKRIQILFFTEWKTLLISLAAIFIYSIGVVGFTIPYKFADQGVMGIAVLLKYAFGLNPAWITLVINVGLLAWGAKVLPKRFIYWTMINVVLMSLMLEAMSYIKFPYIDDMFLVSVTGGVIKGIGIGLLFKEGISGGGLDIILIALKNKYGMEVGRLSFYFNMTILAVSFGIIGLDKVMYGFVSCYISGMTMDSLLSSFDKRKLVFIIASDPDAIVKYINKMLGRGCTMLSSEGGFSRKEGYTVMSLLTQKQAVELKKYIAKNFPGSFMVLTEANEVVGKGFKRWKNI